MGKKISIVIATALTFCVLLVSCGGGGGGGGGGGSAPANTTSTYSGSFTVNNGSYSSVALNSSDNTATVTGSAGTLSGTYTSSRSVTDGTYTITFSDGHTISVTISGNSITFAAGTWPASGTGTLQTSSGGSSGDSSSGSSSSESNASSGSESGSTAAEEQAIYNSLLGTHWKYEEVPLAQRGSSNDPRKNSSGFGNGYKYGCMDLNISANGVLEFHGWFEDASGNNWDNDPSNSSTNYMNKTGSFSIVLEPASSRAAFFLNINGNNERLGYINMGDSNGDGKYDTPREDTFNNQ